MLSDHAIYLKLMINELNSALELNSFTKQLYSPMEYNEIVTSDLKLKQVDRVMVAAEIYRWVMGGKWRLLDLEHILRLQSKDKHYKRKTVKEDMKHLIDSQELLDADVLKMCLLLTGIDERIIEDAKYVVQKKYLYTENPNKLWSSIGYYDMKDRSIHISTGGKTKDKKVVFPLEDIFETAAHELGHHIFVSMTTGRYKLQKKSVKKMLSLLKNVKVSSSKTEHAQWLDFYIKDYGSDWEKNKKVQIIPRDVYIKYGVQNELFAQIISGKTVISKKKRKDLIHLVNEAVCA